MSSTFRTYLALYAYVLRLAVKGIASRPAYLLFAPVVAIVLGLLGPIVQGMRLGILGGFLMGFVQTMGVSALLYAARAIIEQRRMGDGEVGQAVFAFLNDLMTVFFAVWILSMVLQAIAPSLLLVLGFSLLVVPVFETVAFGQAGGFGVFESAWNFFRRDLGPWLAGQVPVLVGLPLYLMSELAIGWIPLGSVPPSFQNLAGVIVRAVPSVFIIIALVYRGILYLTLDGLSPRRRAEKFGGVTPVA